MVDNIAGGAGFHSLRHGITEYEDDTPFRPKVSMRKRLFNRTYRQQMRNLISK